jgi:hypothetical protein
MESQPPGRFLSGTPKVMQPEFMKSLAKGASSSRLDATTILAVPQLSRAGEVCHVN